MRSEAKSNFEPETAYSRGHKAGREDGFTGNRTESFWQLANSEQFTSHQFGQGYRDGFEQSQRIRKAAGRAA